MFGIYLKSEKKMLFSENAYALVRTKRLNYNFEVEKNHLHYTELSSTILITLRVCMTDALQPLLPDIRSTKTLTVNALSMWQFA